MFILAEKASFPIDWMCQKLGVSRASYYRWTRPAVPTPTTVRHVVLDAHVVRVFAREKGMAGRDQTATILSQGGVSIAGGTVGATLNRRGLRAVRMRAWKKTTTVDGTPERSTSETICWTGSGRLYLATVINLSNRTVVGWSMASHMRTGLIIDAHNDRRQTASA
jgi:putative transposase